MAQKGEDSYYYHNPDKFVYKNIHTIVNENYNKIYKEKSKAEFYLYKNEKLHKIEYNKNLSEL